MPGEVAGAAFYNGEYYWVRNGTDDLVKVQFDGEGLIAGGVIPVCEDFTGVTPDNFRFGDIVISPDGSMVYGSSITTGDPTVFFSIDLADCAYTEISTVNGTNLQLALGSNGTLYGQLTGSGEFFTVAPSTGITTLLGVPVGANYGFTDLAAGRCSPWEETAWGSGMQFDGNNWGMYFGCNCEEESIE